LEEEEDKHVSNFYRKKGRPFNWHIIINLLAGTLIRSNLIIFYFIFFIIFFIIFYKFFVPRISY
jgi:hypothetical protein